MLYLQRNEENMHRGEIHHVIEFTVTWPAWPATCWLFHHLGSVVHLMNQRQRSHVTRTGKWSIIFQFCPPADSYSVTFSVISPTTTILATSGGRQYKGKTCIHSLWASRGASLLSETLPKKFRFFFFWLWWWWCHVSHWFKICSIVFIFDDCEINKWLTIFSSASGMHTHSFIQGLSLLCPLSVACISRM